MICPVYAFFYTSETLQVTIFIDHPVNKYSNHTFNVAGVVSQAAPGSEIKNVTAAFKTVYVCCKYLWFLY